MENAPQIVPMPTPGRQRPVGQKARTRSRITNGSALLHGVDGRSAWVRRRRDIIGEHLSDLGGADNTSAADRRIIRCASELSVELEKLEAKFAVAEGASAEDLDLYRRTANDLRRLLEAVGLQRRAVDVGPGLGELLRRDHERQRLEAQQR